MATLTISLTGSAIMADTINDYTINDVDLAAMLGMSKERLGTIMPPMATNEQVFGGAADAFVQEVINWTTAYKTTVAISSVAPILLTKQA